MLQLISLQKKTSNFIWTYLTKILWLLKQLFVALKYTHQLLPRAIFQHILTKNVTKFYQNSNLFNVNIVFNYQINGI